MMQVSDLDRAFTVSIFAESKRLIQIGIWDIEMSRLEGWLSGFISETERYFAACILNQLIYRTRDQLGAALKSLFNGAITREICTESVADAFVLRELQKKSSCPFRLVPVIRDSDPPTKSGLVILRHLKRTLKINSSWMYWPWQCLDSNAMRGIETIIFVDDFLGTGTQFQDFFKKWHFEELQGKEVNLVYVPIFAHEKGRERLTQIAPGMKIIPGEKLGEEHGFFSDIVWTELSDGKISGQNAKEWYLEFVRKNRLSPRSVSPLGAGELSLTLGFSHGAPNNSLSILWYETENWMPLFDR